MVRPAGLAALRAGLQLHEPERKVRAAPTFAALGELYLRESHERAEVYQEGCGRLARTGRPQTGPLRPSQPMRGSGRIQG